MSQYHQHPQDDDKLVALGRTLQTLREEENADVLIETTLDYLTHEFNYRLIWIGLYDRLEHRLFGKGGITPTGDTTFLKQWFNLSPGDVLEQVVIQQRPVGIPNLQQEIRAGEWRRVAQEFGIQGTLLFPLRCKDRCFGVALLASELWGISPRPSEKALLSLLLGGLASALYQIEVNWQYSSVKRPDQSLFQVLHEIMQVPGVEQRLEAVVKMTQQFVGSTRTNMYWYSPERRYFWHRVGNRQPIVSLGGAKTNAPGLTVAEVNDFYQALAADQLVSVGTGRSLLKSESTQRLLGRLRARSLLAAPILVQGELMGFLSVEDSEARIWEEAEVKYVRAAAQLVALVVNTEVTETRLQETQKNAHFIAEIAQVLRNPTDPLHTRSNDIQEALKDCAKLLCTRLDADRFLVLQEEDNGEFTLVFGKQPFNRRPLTVPLPALSAEMREWIWGSPETVMIEDLDGDWRLLQWRESFQLLGVRSLLICPTSKTSNMGQIGSSKSSPLLMMTQSTPRTWNRTQRELVSIVAQQINLLLLLGSYTESAKQLLLAHQTLQTGLSTLFQAPLDPLQLERLWLNYVANLLECPLAALISWTSLSNVATIAATVIADPAFTLAPDLRIEIASDALIQEVLATRHFFRCAVTELNPSTRTWLNSPGIGQVLAIALHTDAIPTTGILLLADHEKRRWPRHLLSVLETLTQQFSWIRHYQYSLTQYVQGMENLQTLNWYKHRCLDILYHSVCESVSALLELEAKILPLSKGESDYSKSTPQSTSSHHSDLNQNQSLQQTHRQQLLHQLEQSLSVLTPVLQDEYWQLSVKPCSIPLASLLKRTIQRVQPLYQQYKIGLQVYNWANKNVFGDRIKLECILFEVLVNFCVQAQPRSRINLWCSPFSAQITTTISSMSSRPIQELLIAESGVLDECFQAVMNSEPMPFPNSNLTICQKVLQTWGGDLQFYELTKGTTLQEQNSSETIAQKPRYSSRLLLPLTKLY